VMGDGRDGVLRRESPETLDKMTYKGHRNSEQLDPYQLGCRGAYQSRRSLVKRTFKRRPQARALSQHPRERYRTSSGREKENTTVKYLQLSVKEHSTQSSEVHRARRSGVAKEGGGEAGFCVFCFGRGGGT